MREPRPFPFDRLPKVARAEAATLRGAARRLPIAAVARALEGAHAWLGAPLVIEALPIERCPPGELGLCVSDPLCAVILEPAAPVRGARIALEIEPRLAAIGIDRVLGGTGEDAAPDPGVLGEVERGVLAYAVARLLAASGGALRVASIVTSPAALALAIGDEGVLAWPARARIGADAGIVRAWIPETALARADLSPHGGPAPDALAAIELEVVIEGGRARLVPADLASLAIGDVVVLDEARARPSGGALIGEVIARPAGGSGRWTCTIEGERVVVRAIDPGAPPARQATKEAAMADEKSAEALVRAAGDAPIDLVVELARVRMTLAELAALRPGEVLATGKALGERVTLRAGERTIAVGELVEIEGEIGVRVISIG